MIGKGELLFQFVLAKDLGMTVGELRDRMDSKEFSEWMVAYKIWNQG